MALFKSKIGLIAATVGSAVGLGTVWRFPAETQANGGAAFLIIYLACAFLLGVPVMLAEFALGRAGRSDASGVFRKLSPGTPWWITGAGAILISYLIMMFYMVVGGWTLEYLVGSVNGDLFDIPSEATNTIRDTFYTGKMQEYVHTPLYPAVATAVFVLLNLVVLIGGVQKGIERMSNIAMPLLFVLLLVFCGVSLSLPKAGEGVRYFLDPDFSKITAGTVIGALGQALFSLSLGMGILITYASYFPDNTRLGRTSFTVVTLTLLVAIMMGLIIFPAVSSFGLTGHEMAGTTLIFVTLPEVFGQMPGSLIWASMFFLLLAIAALTSTVSMAEVAVKYLQDHFGLRRIPAAIAVVMPMALLSSVCSLSFSTLSDFTIAGHTIFSGLDALTNNIMLPAVALLTCVYAGWFAPKGLLNEQFSNNGAIRTRLCGIVIFVIRWLSPLCILAIGICNLI